MATDDRAILVGIARYADAAAFPELQGPFNDVALMREWLLAPDGGDLDPANVVTIVSPHQIPPGTDPDSVPPVTEDFKRAFKRMVRDDTGHFVSRRGRLYLYFSGHGFCERKSLSPQGALYAANATREFPENIFGTHYAQVARDKALFSEIVLVMDCCRDAEVNRSPDVPPINEPGSSAAAAVKLLAIYAAPKGGKALERPIAERGGAVHGLLTHALLAALEQARPDAGDFISATALCRHLVQNWSAVCGAVPAPAPEVVPPTTGTDLLLRSRNHGVAQRFVLGDFPGAPVSVQVLDGSQKLQLACDLQPPPAVSSMSLAGGAPAPLVFDGAGFTLGLQPGFYRYLLGGGLDRDGLFAVPAPGGGDVRL